MRRIVQSELALLVLGFGCLQAAAAEVSSVSDFEKFPSGPSSYERETFQRIAQEEQERFRKRVTLPAEAVQDESQLPASSRPAGPGANVPAGLPAGAASGGQVYWNICAATLGILAGLLLLRRFAPDFAALLNTQFDPWAPSAAAARRSAMQARAEEASFAEFLVAFRTGPAVMPRAAEAAQPEAVRAAPGETAGAGAPREARGGDEVFAEARARLGVLQQLLEEIRWRSGATTPQRKLLDQFLRELGALKEPAQLPGLLPAWQMACALEGLVKQLLSKASYVTTSTLRTIGISLDLLEELCVKGLPADLVTNPPIQLLAVDDDRITRHALSWSLGKALSQPDLAENGDAALALVNRKAYDAIFLDVQMPGMDGFELCTRIHETEPNSITPVVFVTCQSDFNSRAESTLRGGYDLIGKPFLTFEITVVALTLALRRRLQAGHRIATALEQPVSAKRPAPAAELPSAPPIQAPEVRRSESAAALPQRVAELSLPHQAPAVPAGAERVAADAAPAPAAARRPSELAAAAPASSPSASSKGATRQLAEAFFAQAPSHIQSLRDLVQLICHTPDAAVRQDMLGDLYLFIHSLTINAGLAELRAAFQLSAALEGLLKKLLQSPAHSTSATLRTVTAAVDLLGELCVKGRLTDGTGAPPIRLLVVDDDPIACRALGGALQTTLAKPDLAENGMSALTLAAQHSYDVIFLDVLMPDVDGFTLCPKIHETAVNRRTPVVFVTSHSDPGVVAQSTACGGSDFVTKPFLTAEITVKALVYALRHRLQPALVPLPRPETETAAIETANETQPA